MIASMSAAFDGAGGSVNALDFGDRLKIFTSFRLEIRTVWGRLNSHA